MTTTNAKWKLAIATLGGAAALHLVLAACGQRTSPTAQGQEGGSSSGGAGLAPSGSIVAFGGSVAPDGWLICDGSTLSRTQYASLFSAIGVAHGSGDGVTTFNLPDYQGLFLRGVDHGNGIDPDAATRTAARPGGNAGDQVGSLEGDAYATHDHAVNDPGHAHSVTDPGHGHGVNDPGHQHGISAGQYYTYYNGSTCAGANFDLGSGTAACFDVNPGTGASGTNVSIQGATTGISIGSAQTGITIAPSGKTTETRPRNADVVWIIKT
jgi:phage-related tail fiber protein